VRIALLLLSLAPLLCRAESIDADLLIVGGDEAGCAAAVQAARLGVPRIVLVNDLEWLGGQFCTQGIGPLDEWTIVEGKRVNFPRSGLFLEIVERVRAHKRTTYGVASWGDFGPPQPTFQPEGKCHVVHPAPLARRPWDRDNNNVPDRLQPP
jgi:hypothetical protein